MTAYATALTLILTLGSPMESEPPAQYFMVVFAAQKGNRPKYAHTFATFIKQKAGDDSELELATLSWIGTRTTWNLFGNAQPGRNLTLEATLQRCQDRGQQVSMWGPYQIKPELYERAVAQKAKLEAGEIFWQALDYQSRRNGTASNCIHVICDLCLENGMLATGSARGESASAMVVKHLSHFIIESGRKQVELCDALGLTSHSIRAMPDPF
jgi:hypothetical protein